MFCPNCGKNLPDNSVFCDGCGSKVAEAAAPAVAPAPVAAPVQPTPVAAPVQPTPVAAPVQPAPVYAPPQGYTQAPVYTPAQPNPFLDDFLNALKGFFSKDPANGIEKASKSEGIEWLIFYSISMFFGMFYSALAPCHYEADFNALGLLGGMLEFSLYFFGVSIAVLLMFKMVYNKDVSLMKVFNVTAVAMLPLGLSYCANIILGFIWSGLVSVSSSVAVIAFAALLYVGLQKLADAKVSVWNMVVIFSIVLLLLAGWDALWVELTTPKSPYYYYFR